MTNEVHCKKCAKPGKEVAVLIPYGGEHLCDLCVIEMNRDVLQKFALEGESESMENAELRLAEELEEEQNEWSPLHPMDEDSIERIISRIQDSSSIELCDLSEECFDPDAVALLPREVAEQFCLIPIRKEGDELTVAFSDPADLEAMNEVRYVTGMEIKAVAADPDDIEDAIRTYYQI